MYDSLQPERPGASCETLRICAKLLAVSEQPSDGAVPTWDLPDRLRKALRHSGIGVTEMAGYLGVTRGTVSTWINGRIQPSVQTLRLWALRCGVSYDWLCGGQSPHRRLASPAEQAEVRTPGRCTPRQALYAVAA
jgi:transcriptional regulator with XRE-family HTH domain